MAHVGHDAADGAALRDRRREEEPEGAMAGKVRRTADTVHHGRTAHKAAVHVAENVGLEGGIHRDYAHAADDVGTVAHFLLAEHEMLFPIGSVLHEFLLGGLRERERRTARHPELALLQEREHGLLDDFGKQVDAPEAVVVGHRAKHRIGNLPDSALVGHSLREPAVRFLEPDKVEDAFADILRNLVGFHEGSHLVKGVVLDNRNYLVRINLDKIVAHAVACGIDRQGLRVRREFGQGVIVHADTAVTQTGVQFQDDFRRHVQVAYRIAARGGKAYAAIRQDGAHLDHGDSGRRDCARAHKVTHLAEVGVDIADAAVVDSLAQARVALVGHAELERTCAGQGPVAAVAGRGSRIERHLELFAGRMQLLGAGRERKRDRLGVAGQCKARNPEDIAIVNHRRGIFRGTLLAFNPIHKLSIFPSSYRTTSHNSVQ